MTSPNRTIIYGDRSVPVHVRDWISGERQPYRKTYALRPGQHWHEAPETTKQWEHYVLLSGGDFVPVGAMIARELVESGVDRAVFTELWGRRVLVGPDLICMAEDGPLGELLDELKHARGGKLAGLPDVVGLHADGRIVMREAKNVGAKDRLSKAQHEFARVAQRLLGDRLDLAVVEWGLPHGPDSRSGD